MPYVKPETKIAPVGVNPALNEDRMPVIQVINGDTWTVDADLYNPANMEPATVDNTYVEFVLTENRFVKDPFWVGTWYEGVLPDEHVPGLVHVKVPAAVSAELRRGIYAFSIRVTDYLDKVTKTELTGHFQVEYEPTSDTHNIPYRRGT